MIPHYLFSENTPVFDYDRDHPVNVTATVVGTDYMNVTWALPQGSQLNNSDLVNFVVHYMKREHKMSKLKFVAHMCTQCISHG